MQAKATPRRVLYVENGIGYGGATICLRHLVANLDRQHYEPLVITGRNGPEYQGIATEAKWLFLRDRYIDTFGMQSNVEESTLANRIPGMRITLLQIIARLDDIANFTPFFFKLLWHGWRFRPELIHANNEPLCNRAALMVAKLLRVPCICHVRGTPTGSTMMKWTYGLVDHFIPVSHWISAGICKLGIPSGQQTVIYDGIALEKLDPAVMTRGFRQTFGLPPDAFVVGLVGLLIPWKGQMLFLDAAKKIKEAIPNVQLLIIGGTPKECHTYEQKLRNRVKHEDMRSFVHFTGHVDDMPQVYADLDVAVSASTSPEPLGTMVIETMASGRPLVAPNHGGAAEMAVHEQHALLFEPNDANSLSDMIIRLFKDESLRTRLGQAARMKALATFDISTHVDSVVAVYDELLSTNARNTAR
jgi:glycosyltransferase involved in cell wall biosynthesis